MADDREGALTAFERLTLELDLGAALTPPGEARPLAPVPAEGCRRPVAAVGAEDAKSRASPRLRPILEEVGQRLVDDRCEGSVERARKERL